MSLQGTLTVCASSPCSRRRRAAAVSVYQAGCWCWPWRRSVTRWGDSQTSRHKKVWFEIRRKARLLFLVTKGNRVMTKIASKVKSKEMFCRFDRFLHVLISCFSALPLQFTISETIQLKSQGLFLSDEPWNDILSSQSGFLVIWCYGPLCCNKELNLHQSALKFFKYK